MQEAQSQLNTGEGACLTELTPEEGLQRSLMCLYAAVDTKVADDVCRRIKAVLLSDLSSITKLTLERNRLREVVAFYGKESHWTHDSEARLLAFRGDCIGPAQAQDALKYPATQTSADQIVKVAAEVAKFITGKRYEPENSMYEAYAALPADIKEMLKGVA
jgi:hypothetical protein